jgi:nitronate monooxygenase
MKGESSMFKTKITEMFGIQYPIIQGGMFWVSKAELAAAVSNAGGLGILSSSNLSAAEELREEIWKTKSLTDKPFGVNFPFLPTVRPTDTEKFVDVVLDEGVKIVETAGRSPEPYMKQFKDGGIKVIHKVPAVRFAQTAERVGVDAIAILGCEGGGHIGLEYVSSAVLLPQAVQSLKLPVIAAGGFGDAHGFVAALAMGAEGVLMGTRFMASKESPVHPGVKEWLINAKEADTMLIQQSIRNTARVIRNKPAEKTLEMEQKGAPLEELLPVITGLKEKKLFETGDLDAGVMHCGQVVGLIQEIPTVKEIIDGIISGAKSICYRLHQTAEAQ